MYFTSWGLSVRMQPRRGFQMTVISSKICGLFPFALLRNFLSFKAYHLFSPLLILNSGMAILPKNSTLWSRSSSNTVISRTLLISLMLKVKIFCQEGANVLYSVWVWRRAFPNSTTQNGSLFPPKSAAAKPVARNTLTIKWPTSLML